ncbi:MAG: ferredoxin family protein [Thermoprotei archaeon]|nr:MAG: ferredoxin family protein [Thermoprotei archaeon]
MSTIEKKLSIEERLALDVFNVDKEPHIIVDTEKCKECETKPCLYVCPANLYTLEENGELKFNYEGCLECGSCRIVCPHDAIKWNYPRGTFGVHFRFG